MSLDLSSYLAQPQVTFPPILNYQFPWEMTIKAAALVEEWMGQLGSEYRIEKGIAIHRTAKLEEGVILKAPVIISAHCFIGAHAYLRGGVFLAEKVVVGPGCEVKSSFIFPNTALAHFNFVGDSVIGSFVNMEAGAVIANHYNERKQKAISVLVNGQVVETGVDKFGALIGDYTRIGANAVTSPGTILPPQSVVKRLELVEQLRDNIE